MELEQIKNKIVEYRRNGMKMFSSSSFQTHSLVLLHILSRIDNGIPIYFMNTGYHFPETIRFRDQVVGQFGLNLVDLKPSTPKSMQKDAQNRLLFTSDPEHCCYLNKIQPLEPILIAHDIWVNGIRADQNQHREGLSSEESAPHGVTRYHPMLDWSVKMIFDYIKENDLPRHPMDQLGYMSIGCEPCTRKWDLETQEREARWYGLNKNECGLHTDLLDKKP